MNGPATMQRPRAPAWRAVGAAALACAVLVADPGAGPAAVAGVAGAAPAGAGVAGGTVRPSAEDALVRRVNREREAAGLRPLTVDLQLTRGARNWTDTMARRGRLSHNPGLRSEARGSWGRLGENVGYARHAGASQSDLVRRMHRSFMSSSGHRANVLGRFNRVGVGVRITGDRTMWVTVVFGDGSSAGVPLFRDAAGSTHEAAINRLWRDGAVTGCRHERYCPDRPLTRGQLATMLVRAVDGVGPAGGAPFRDVRAGDRHAAGIAGLARAGVVSGCGRGRFCPNEPVSRGQMATMLVRAVGGLGRADPSFRDVRPGSPHARTIGGVAAAEVTRGCATGRFCPHAPVSRAQAASMVARASRR